MSQLVRDELWNVKLASLVLVASGSGINYIIDMLQWCILNKPNCYNISVLYSTRDPALFEWVKGAVSKLCSHLPSKDETTSLTISLALTSTDASVQVADPDLETSRPYIRTVAGRLNFDDEVPEGATVFCQGSLELKNAVKKVCRNKKGVFVGGIGGS